MHEENCRGVLIVISTHHSKLPGRRRVVSPAFGHNKGIHLKILSNEHLNHCRTQVSEDISFKKLQSTSPSQFAKLKNFTGCISTVKFPVSWPFFRRGRGRHFPLFIRRTSYCPPNLPLPKKFSHTLWPTCTTTCFPLIRGGLDGWPYRPWGGASQIDRQKGGPGLLKSFMKNVFAPGCTLWHWY